MVFGWARDNNTPTSIQNIVTKLDKKGNVLWQKPTGGNFYPDYVYMSNNGDFILHGIDITADLSGFINIVGEAIIDIDQSGNKIWHVKSDSSIFFNSGNFHNVTIEDNGTIEIITTDSLFNIYLKKYTPNGTQIFKKLIPDFKASVVYNLIKTSPNSFVFNSTDTSTRAGNRKRRFTCIDSTGDVLWNKQYNKDTSFYNLMLIGNTIYSLQSVQDSITLKYDLSCYKYDISGNLISKKQLVSAGYWQTGSFFNFSKNIKDGFYFFVNQKDSINNNYSYSKLFKIDENLNEKWRLTFNTPIQCIDTGNCNSIVCSFAQYGSYDNTIESIKDPELDEVCEKCENTVFPNPVVDDFINIRSDHPDVFIENIEMFDYSGKSVWSNATSINSNLFMLNHNLGSGVYICRIGCDNGKEQVKKVLIAK